ncbi:stress adaptor protein CpxP [Vibrio sp. HA2012]|uniref:CpxP family protein n=1 Tax=Vibrio sp. HA2012 TaxID=1971595 RepID=UPI000C2B6557|nr:CpxP family protein [Vibrio sp. HA2012]PJC85655.1 stress adaptor protein CpxP [Vibrio sp. HA2012]
MKSVKKLVLAVAVLPIALSTASAYAFGGPGGGAMGGPGDYCGVSFGPRLLDDLDLTNEQLGQLRDLRTTQRKDMQANRDARREDRQEFRAEHQKAMQELMLSADFDETKAMKLAKAMGEQMAAQRAEQQVKMLKQQHAMLSILTDAQKEKLLTLQAEHMQQCAADMGPGGRGGKGGKHW